jgi:hypothetical protein
MTIQEDPVQKALQRTYLSMNFTVPAEYAVMLYGRAVSMRRVAEAGPPNQNASDEDALIKLGQPIGNGNFQ